LYQALTVHMPAQAFVLYDYFVRPSTAIIIINNINPRTQATQPHVLRIPTYLRPHNNKALLANKSAILDYLGTIATHLTGR